MNWSPSPTLGVVPTDRLQGALVSASFWLTVAIPAVLIGLLVLGLETSANRNAFLALMAAYPVVAALGHGYGA
jgi:hypothetical protein